jgi:hypothetical protein
VYQAYQFRTAPLLQNMSFWGTEQRFHFLSLVASSVLVDLQPERKFLHDLKMTAQCLAEIINYSQMKISKETLKEVSKIK